ncbi:MAG: phospholipase D-like domain-containing protein [Perlucidibaca sp.]
MSQRPVSLTDPAHAGLFARVTGASALPGHRLQLLRDSDEHERAALALVAQARHHIIIENYRLVDDDWGRALVDALCAQARKGVRVRLLCDWLGSWGRLGRLPALLRDAGAELRRFNTPGLGEPLAWIVRNHRKLLSVDGCEAMITGWCLSAQWRGKPGGPPWRDTGVRVAGPVVAEAEAAFAQTWRLAGGDSPGGMIDHTHCPLSDMTMTVDQAQARLLVGRPQRSPLFQLDQLVISLARERIWLTDAYPVGTPTYLDSLRRAARDGVDVRLLVPGSTDLPLLGMLSRSGYRALLEAGVRVFEWNGPMLHAKTAVVDGEWARIGSSNLNPASWLGNYELDLVVEDPAFGEIMETQYLNDLERSTEIVLRAGQKVQLLQPRASHRRGGGRRPQLGSATALRLSRAMAMAVRESRRLGPADASLLGLLGGSAVLLAIVAAWRPAWVAWPLAVLAAWGGINLLRIAWRRYRHYRAEDDDAAN